MAEGRRNSASACLLRARPPAALRRAPGVTSVGPQVSQIDLALDL